MNHTVRRCARWLVSLVVLWALTAGPLHSLPVSARGLNPVPAVGPVQRPAPAQAPAALKLLVDAGDTETLRQLVAQGAELLVDYGAFSLWRVSAAQAAALPQRSGLALRPDLDTIPLRGTVIDTRPGASQPVVAPGLSQSRALGSQFWMVQFVGPITDDWLKQLAGFGLQGVIYMPHNAYVVWGDAASLARLDEWAAKAAVVQWTGAYHPAYRLAPSLQAAAAAAAPDQLVNVTVQFYTTAAVEQSLAQLLALGVR